MQKKFEKNIRNKKGITLIALVITIIALLLLAGISIAMLAGNNSVLNRGGQSRAANALGAAKDEVGMKVQAVTQDYFLSVYNSNTIAEQGATYSKNELDRRAMDAITEIETQDISIKQQGGKNWSDEQEIILQYNPDGTTVKGILNNGVITWENIAFERQSENKLPDLYLIKNGIDQSNITGGWGHYSYTGSAGNMAGFMNWQTGYLSFGENGTMNDCHNPYTKGLINLRGYKYVCIDYAIPTNTLAGNPTTYWASSMRVCLDETTSADASIKTGHKYYLGYIMNGKETVERKTVKFNIEQYENDLSLSFCGWVSPNKERLEVRVYNIYLSNEE